jgi:hypothetical protein
MTSVLATGLRAPQSLTFACAVRQVLEGWGWAMHREPGRSEDRPALPAAPPLGVPTLPQAHRFPKSLSHGLTASISRVMTLDVPNTGIHVE